VSHPPKWGKRERDVWLSVVLLFLSKLQVALNAPNLGRALLEKAAEQANPLN